jgi:hypothetical protein
MAISHSAWLDSVRVIAKAFSDTDFQRRAWRGEAASSFGSPDEMMCVYFDDVLVPEFIDENRAEIGEQCATAGIALTKLLQQFPWPMNGGFISAELLVEMPQWASVCDAAHRFLESLPVAGVESH